MTIRVFDFFAGCGGTSCGLQQAGFEIVFAVDNDPVAVNSFRANFPKAHAVVEDIQNLNPQSLTEIIGHRDTPLLFCGCAPCQPFSKQNNNKKINDPRIDLLSEYSRFVKYWRPEFILIENVPGIQKSAENGPLSSFQRLLKKHDYVFDVNVLASSSYGVPQKRERLVLLASNQGKVRLPKPTHGTMEGQKPYSTVSDWISGLPALQAGQVSRKDPDHRAASLSEINLKRIKATPEGGGRNSWPKNLWLECHKNHTGHSDVYGRLHRKKLASGLTTRCISLSNGRFGHPTQNRAISVREAACLQTFPREYTFRGSLAAKAKQVGNAVPPLFAKRLGESIANAHKSVIPPKNHWKNK